MKKTLNHKKSGGAKQTLTLPSPRGGGGKRKVLVALSGGIDSAVSAYLLIKKGYQVEAAFMKNWSSTEGLLKNECPWLVDRQDALRVAAFLRVPLHTLDFEKQYQKNVMKYFFEEYKKGRTPNPDVMCNKEIKFKLLYNWAIKNGFDYLATGHYAKIVDSEQWTVNSGNKQDYPLPTNHCSLFRSADEFKDQTYFIYNIKTAQLPHLLFPIGAMKKSAVRSLARKIGLPNAEKRESMGLCFVGKIRLKDFLEQKLKPKKGPIVLIPPLAPPSKGGETAVVPPLTKGRLGGVVIGRHQGLYNYTIGQRQGIAIGGGGPYYVVKKDLKSNTLYVTNNADDPALMTREVQLHSVNWIREQWNIKHKTWSKTAKMLHASSFVLHGRFRHQGDLVPLIIAPMGKGHYRVIFRKPQKAVASGQSLVLYKGKECVGGGVIV
jgi:tRNA-uridine 2-sulfurtransferase